MQNEKQLRRFSLIGLYGLFLIAACLVHQLKDFPFTRVVLPIVLILIIVFWRYLAKKKIIAIGFSSTIFQRNLRKEERLFLYGFVILFMPVLKLRGISIGDVVFSIILIIVVIGLFVMDEIYFKKNSKAR